MTNWYNEGLKDIRELRDAIHTHRINKTTLTTDGVIALEMKLNFLIKCFKDKPEDAWRKCPTCGDNLVYSHRVTTNSWTYLCQRCKTVHHVTEDEKTKERSIVVYDERMEEVKELRQQGERDRG